MMFGMTQPLMRGDDGDTGGGGPERNREAVSIREESFQSPFYLYNPLSDKHTRFYLFCARVSASISCKVLQLMYSL